MAAAGDIGAVDFYRDRDRIKIGDPATLADRLLAAWQHDQDQGLDSLMLAPSRRQVADLNQRARAARLAGTHLRKFGPADHPDHQRASRATRPEPRPSVRAGGSSGHA